MSPSDASAVLDLLDRNKNGGDGFVCRSWFQDECYDHHYRAMLELLKWALPNVRIWQYGLITSYADGTRILNGLLSMLMREKSED